MKSITMTNKRIDVLAKFLKEKRLAVGLSQRDVADKLGYSTPQFISNWERGVSIPPISVLKKLGEFYKVSSEELFNIILKSTVEKITAELRRKFNSSRTK